MRKILLILFGLFGAIFIGSTIFFLVNYWFVMIPAERNLAHDVRQPILILWGIFLGGIGAFLGGLVALIRLFKHKPSAREEQSQEQKQTFKGTGEITQEQKQEQSQD